MQGNNKFFLIILYFSRIAVCTKVDTTWNSKNKKRKVRLESQLLASEKKQRRAEEDIRSREQDLDTLEDNIKLDSSKADDTPFESVKLKMRHKSAPASVPATRANAKTYFRKLESAA